MLTPDLMARSRDDDARARLSWPKPALLAPISDNDRRLVVAQSHSSPDCILYRREGKKRIHEVPHRT